MIDTWTSSGDISALINMSKDTWTSMLIILTDRHDCRYINFKVCHINSYFYNRQQTHRLQGDISALIHVWRHMDIKVYHINTWHQEHGFQVSYRQIVLTDTLASRDTTLTGQTWLQTHGFQVSYQQSLTTHEQTSSDATNVHQLWQTWQKTSMLIIFTLTDMTACIWISSSTIASGGCLPCATLLGLLYKLVLK